jgi:hypothetical protein
MASDLPPVPVAARMPLTSLADPAWGEVVPPDMGAVLTYGERQSLFAAFRRDVPAPAPDHPCYACGQARQSVRCPMCRRPACFGCWRGSGGRCCQLEVPDGT